MTFHTPYRGIAFQADEADALLVSQYTWQLTASGYIVTKFRIKRKYYGLSLHRIIMNAPRGVHVDHINGDRMDNRRCNLRLCTHHENMRNKTRASHNTSGFKGVSLCRKMWRAQIGGGGDGYQTHIGHFDTREQAARAYDSAAIARFGPFARLNFPISTNE